MRGEAGSTEGRRGFHVREAIEVYDEMTARTLARVLGHLSRRIPVARDTATQEEIAASIKTSHDVLDVHDPDRDHLTHVLLDECPVGLQRLAELAGASNAPNRQQHILTTILTTVSTLEHSAT